MKEVAITAAYEAGHLMLEWRRKFPAGPAAMDYKDAKDVVTEVDTRAEAIIMGYIQRNYPEHNILGEETGLSQGHPDSPYTWIVDPLDGTANFAADLATSCVSIGLAKDDQMVLGVVYNPFRDELFVAERGKGATLNGQPIHASHTATLAKALVCFDLGYNEPVAVEMLRQATFFRPQVRSMRILGSAVLGLVNVAVGRFDLFYHSSLKPWDMAAALLICEEAGAAVTDNQGQPASHLKPSIIATAKELHPLFMQQLESYRQQKTV
ncbi:MAG TPA: inositol monophosphatase family protein [Chloroflexia bacterium]|nr:inositol monophosphatase family protein [Chloroflexia bacterium]